MSTRERLGRLSPQERQALLDQLVGGRRETVCTNEVERLPLSSAQQRIWTFEQLNSGSAAYNIVSAIRFRGALDREALRWAFQQVVNRHEILRTRFTEDDEGVRQDVVDDLEVRIDEVDGRALGAQVGDEALQQRLSELSAVDFELSTLPLFKLTVLRLAADSAVLVVVLHHILADGWSLRLLERETSRFYLDYLQDRRPVRKPAEHQFRNHVQWQSNWRASARRQAQLDYWKATLDDAPTGRLPLPTRNPRRESASLAASSLVCDLPQDTLAALRDYSEKHDVTLFMPLMAAFKVAVGYFAGVEDVTVGTPVANRSRRRFEQVIGLFSNTLAIRTRPEQGKRFADYVQEVRRQTLGAYANQELPFDEVVDAVAPARSAAHSPLFQVLFALQSSDASELNLGDVTIEPVHLERRLIEFDLVAELFLTGRDGKAVLSYRTELYTREFVRALWESYRQLLAGLVREPERTIESHRRALRYTHVAAADDAEPGATMTGGSPDRTAVIADGRELTARELQEEAAAVAGGVADAAAMSEAPLLIVARDSMEATVAMLALQASGLEHALVHAETLARDVSLLVDAGVRIMVCRGGEPEQSSAGCRVRSVASLHRPGARPVEPLQPSASLWTIEDGRAWQLTGGELRRSADFVRSSLHADGRILLAGRPGMDLQLSVTYAALADGRALQLTDSGAQATAAVSRELREAHAAFVPGGCTAADAWGENLTMLVHVGADVADLPQRPPCAACFASARHGGVFLWHRPNGDPRLRPGVPTAWLMNALGEALPDGGRGHLFLPTASGEPAATGLVCELRDRPCALASSTTDRVWHRGRLVDLEILNARLAGLPGVDDAILRIRRDAGGRRRLLCYVKPGRQVTETELETMAASVLDAHTVPDAFVIVSHIPVDRSGAVDLAEIDRTPVLPAIDESSAAAGETADRRIAWDLPPQPRLAVGGGASPRPAGHDRSKTAAASDEAPAIVRGAPLDSPCPFSCLAEVLEHAASEHGEQQIVFIADADGRTVDVSYRGLREEALRVAGGLAVAGLGPRDIVMLQLADNPGLTLAYWGCVLAGVVPIVAATPESYAAGDKDADKIVRVCESIGIAGIVGGEASFAGLQDCREVRNLGCRLLDLRQLAAAEPLPDAHRADGDDTAQMLLTSGSTGLPKAVMQSHRALLSRTRGEVQAFGFTSDDVSFNWMPMDHVGGLVMHHLTYLYLGAQQVHCPTPLVLAEPLHWLRWMSEYEATTTWAPNFAYSLVNERFRESGAAELGETDLSALRFFYNGGEAVVASVAEQFATKLTALGMRQGAIKPVWGMSETCSGVIVNTEYDPHAGAEGDVVNVGRPLPGVDVRIVDADDRVIREGVSGRLQLSGPIITQGYRNNATATKEAFTPDGWFCTGDLARIDDGRITITGREKDLLIINGRNYHCQEVEQVIDKLPAVLSAHVAACGVRMEADATEKLAVFYSNQPEEADADQALAQIRQALLSELGLPVSYAIRLRPEQFPRTSIGKIQRNELVKALQAGWFTDGFRHVGATQTLPAWFYRETWLRRRRRGSTCDADATLIVGSDSSVNGRCRQALRDTAGPVLEAGGGDRTGDLPAFDVRAASSEDWESLLAHAIPAGRALRIVYAEPLAWRETSSQLPELIERSDDTLVRPLVRLARSLGTLADESARRFELVVLTRGACRLSADGTNEPLQGMLNGFLKSLALEYPGIGVSQLDMPWRWEDELQQLDSELCERLVDPVVALRNGQRFVQTLEAADEDAFPKQLREVDSSGFDIVVGGLGGIGSHITEWLLRNEKTQVLALGRTSAREKSPEVSRFAGCGGRFAYERLDVGDADGLAALIRDCEARWDKPLKRVWNAAGEHCPGSIEELEDGNLLALMRSKLAGPVAIQAALERSKADDISDVEQIHIGSVQGYFGGTGLSLYAAANGFLNAWCERQHGMGLKVSCYQFSMWDNVGLTEGYRYERQTREQGFHVLSPNQGVLSLHLLAGTERSPSWLIGLDPGKVPMHSQISGRYRGLRCLHWPSASGEVRDAFGTAVPLRRAGADIDENEAERRALSPLERQIAGIWRALLKLDVELAPDADFFELGGNSLHIARLTNQLRERFEVDLKMQSIFDNSSLREFAALVQAQQESPYEPIARRAGSGLVPASSSQHRVWFLDQMQGDSREYNILAGLRLEGALDLELLSDTLRLLVERHSILRTRYCERDGRCMQDVQADVDLPILRKDLRGLDDAAKEREVQSMMQAAVSQRFDLRNGPLLRVGLVSLDDREHVLLFCMHHIASDGWSMGILSRDFMGIYKALSEGTEPELPALPIEYADYAEWHREYQESDAYRSQEAYWLRQLADLPALHNLPLDHPRTRRRSVQGASVTTRLDADTTARLRLLARAHDSTLFVILHAAFALLLSRRANETDVVVGTPVAGRGHPDLEQLVGFFVNTLVLRSRIDEEQSVAGLLADDRQRVLDAFAHQDVPFDALIDLLGAQRSVSHMPLVQVMFALQNFDVVDPQLPDLEVSAVDTPLSSVRFELELFITEREEELALSWNFATDLFEPGSIEAMAAEYERLLLGMAADPQARLVEVGCVDRTPGRAAEPGRDDSPSPDDAQRRFRGYTISLPALCRQLAEVEGAGDAWVDVREVDGVEHLVAYLQTDPTSKPRRDEEDIRDALKQRLPDYLLPSALCCVDGIPTRDDGNVDVDALPDVTIRAGAEYVAPATAFERRLADTWADVLNVERVGVLTDFFELGGNSLSVTRLVLELEDSLGREVPVATLYENPTVRDLAAALENPAGATDGNGAAEIAKAAPAARTPLSFSQQQLWLIHKADVSSSQYNVPYILKLDGELHEGALRRALTELVTRHQPLRTTYGEDDGVPYQVVNEVADSPLELVDLRGSGWDFGSPEVERILEEEVQRPFDLGADVMLRALLIALGPTEHLLAVTLHHIATDGWSMPILGRELSILYAAFKNDGEHELPALPIDYVDYAVWQRNRQSESETASQLAYWRDKLKDAPLVHGLPLDRPRQSMQGTRAELIEADADRELTESLRALAGAHGATLFMVLQSAFAVLVARWSGEKDTVMAIPVAGRDRTETVPLIGCFNNTLAFRTDLSDDPAFATLLARAKRTAIDAFSNSNVPFERVVEALNPERSQAYNPLCQIKFALQNQHEETLAMEGLEVTAINALERNFSQLHFDLDLSLFETDEGLKLFLGFKRDLFSRSSMQPFLAGYLQLLRAIVARPTEAVSRLPLIDPGEVQAYLSARRGEEIEVREECIHRTFDGVASREPDRIAIRMGDVAMSYRELGEKSDRLAGWLLGHGAGSGDWVVLHQRRGPALLLAMLAVLKTGAAYIPVDPANSSARIRAILRDVAPKILLHGGGSGETNGASIPALAVDDGVLDADWLAGHERRFTRPDVSMQASAYSIYTSGSSGTPKGVDISHRSLADYCAGAARSYYRADLSGAILATSHGFDLAVPSLFLPLLHGGVVRMFSEDSEVAEFARLLGGSSGDAFLIRLTPMHLRALLQLLPEGEVFGGAHVFVVGGEAMPVDVARRLHEALPHSRVYNHYGPTEATVGCCMFDVTAHLDKLRHSVPIGRPMHNAQLMVLDEALQHCPDGMPGELFAGGPGLARGYLGQREETERAFMENPYLPGQRMYRTGDRVRCLADGNFEYLGRLDEQVKVRGFRVEPGEIRTALQREPEVKDAFVAVSGTGDRTTIVACITASDSAIDPEILRARLEATLPAYMVPSELICVDEFPLDDNGKVDARRLRALASQEAAEATPVSRMPRSPLQKQVAAIWADILALDPDRIGLESDFYDLGGQSLLAMRLLAAIRKDCRVDVTVVELFGSRRLGELCRLIETRTMLEDLRPASQEPSAAEETEITI